MIIYFLKVIACSGIFIAAYYLLLERDKMHRFNRFYLLATVLLSLVIPLITIELQEEAYVTQTTLSNSLPIDLSTAFIPSAESETSSIPLILTIGYVIIVMILLIRFSKNLITIIRRAGNSKATYLKGAQVIILNEPIIPHTFLNYIFINQKDFANQQILTHELTHFRQRHSLDILFIELLQCTMWFNPALIFYKKAIRLNHEFLADESVIQNHKNIPDYQTLLLSTLTGAKTTALVSSLKYSITKKRFTMMTTLPSKKRALTKIMVTLLVLCAATAFFSNKVYSQKLSTESTPDLYTIYKDGKWQNQKPSTNPGPINGIASLMKSLQRQLKYPAAAKTSGVEGDVLVMFEVNENGKLKNYLVVKKLHADCDDEVIAALKNSGINWKPAVLDGKSYPSRFVIPVSFRLDPSQIKNSYDLSIVLARQIPQIVVVTSRPENLKTGFNKSKSDSKMTLAKLDFKKSKLDLNNNHLSLTQSEFKMEILKHSIPALKNEKLNLENSALPLTTLNLKESKMDLQNSKSVLGKMDFKNSRMIFKSSAF